MLTRTNSHLELQNCTTTPFVSISVNKSSTNAICRDILRKLGEVLVSSDNSPTSSDVLCGRGKMSVDHPGNKAFRCIIALHLDTYLAVRHRRAKTVLVADLVKTLREYGVKFVKKDPKSGGWCDVGDQEAHKKVGHAFRDAHSERKVRELRVLACAPGNEERQESKVVLPVVVTAAVEKSNTKPMIANTSSTKRKENSGCPSSLRSGDYLITTSSPDAHSFCLDYQLLSPPLATTKKEERYQQPTADDDLLLPIFDWEGYEITEIDEDLEQMAMLPSLFPSASCCTTSVTTVTGLDTDISLPDMNTTTGGLAELEKFLFSHNENEVNSNYLLSEF
jgi:hypothetical protein